MIVLITYARAHGSMNPYVQTAKEFNIHPPSLTYGYPVWNTLNLKPANGIIFLQSEMTLLEKINDNTYAGKPSQENAEIIYHFTQNENAQPLYHIVPDSNLTLSQLFQFMEWMTTLYRKVDFCLWSNEGKFTLVRAEDRYHTFYEWPPQKIQAVTILNNCSDEFMIEGEYSNFYKIKQIIYEIYTTNFLQEKNAKCFFWTSLNKNNLESLLKEMNESFQKCLDPDSSVTDCFTEKIERCEKYLSFIEKHKELSILSPTPVIQIKLQCLFYRKIQTYYNILNEVNKGVYKSRDWYSQQKFERPYLSFLKPRWSNYLNYIHEQFPDVVCYHYYSETPDMLGW
ncbi:MAG: hypothetical protein IPM74_06845 [Crocinitomicaceae bacterium]|nr:hypothetical protein [Crocinitomicaceae bacterium]MBK8925616.1 hypothetical protein [Crocinitomicaceae bacterium]